MTDAKLTREELYKLVWETPMVTLAGRYGITGNGLAKICRRLDVPYPSRGYWAKRAAGKSVSKELLPKPKSGTPSSVRISATIPKSKCEPPSTEAVALADKLRKQFFPTGRDIKRVKRHAVILQWHDRHEQEVARYRKLGWDPPKAFSPIERRKHRLLSVLFTILEAHGGKVAETERSELKCVMNGEEIVFQLREKLRRVNRDLTESERKWSPPGDRQWKTELVPSGLLALSTKTPLPGRSQQDWAETSEVPFERILPEIAAAFILAGPLLVRQREERDERERLRRIAEHEQYLERERVKLDRNRWTRFVELAHRHREAEDARLLLQAIKEAPSNPKEPISGRTVPEWLLWAEQWLEAYDPANLGAERIFQDIGQITSWTYRE